MGEAIVELCDVCGGLWAEQRIVHQIVLGGNRNVCFDCLKEGLHR